MFVKHGVSDVPWYLLGLADVFGRPGAESKSHGHGRDLLLQTGGHFSVVHFFRVI